MRLVSLVLVLSVGLAGCANRPGRLPIGGKDTDISKSKVETGVKLARIQEKEGRLLKALQVYEDLYRMAPDNAEICHRLMVVHSRLDHPEQADHFFQKANALQPNSAKLYADYGYACYLRGDLKDAETWLKKAQQLHPHEERIIGNLALVLGVEGRTKESLTYYRQFLDEAQAQANVGYALLQRGDFAGAREHYTRALEVDPHLKPAQHALLQLAEWEKAAKKTAAHQSKSRSRLPQEHPTGTASIRGS